MAESTEREILETFEGPNGSAELFELVTTDPAHPHVEQVKYEVVFNGCRPETSMDMRKPQAGDPPP